MTDPVTPPFSLLHRPAPRYRLGVDLGGTKIEAIALDPAGSVLLRHRVPTPRNDYPATLAAIARLIADIETALSGDAPPPDPPVPVGIGIPGALSRATGRVKNANSTWLNGQALDRDLERVLNRPVRLANDADCFALSEAVDGAAAGAASVFGVILGTGVGGGLVIRGRLVCGPNAICGEWGHMPLPWPRDDERPGPACYCGRSGCVETLCSGPGLAADHAGVTGEILDPPTLVARAAAGDPAACASLDRHADRLARALAVVITLLDPEVIVLGGGIGSMPHLPQVLPRLWAPWVFSDRVDTRLVTPRFGDSSGGRGAAWLWPDRVADDPLPDRPAAP